MPDNNHMELDAPTLARIREVGIQLASEYLELQRQGFNVPPRIRLIGGTKNARQLLAKAISATLRYNESAQRVRVLSVARGVSPAYLIDTQYFVR
jgi:hypothetical protein